jgi:Carboxypeptidase regulatory-like domain
MRSIRLLLVLFAATLFATPASAQTVRGVVVDEAARPVTGMLVRLVLPTGRPAAGGALTDAQGRFTLAAPAPGRYTIRGERVGYRAATVVVDLASGETAEVRLQAAVQAFVLPTLEVSAARCTVRPGEGEAAYALWEEARKALATTALLHEQRQVEYTVRTYGSELMLRSGRMRRQNAEPSRVVGNPFHTLSPAELAAGGYVREEGDSISLYGPDASVLLSDEFLDTHCLYVDPERFDRQTVALAFQPVRERRPVDIQGTLHLDRRTGELREVEYEYTGLEAGGQRLLAGGTVEFRRTPTGAWVVSRWRIHSSRVVHTTDWSRRGVRNPVVEDLREAGGEVVRAVMLEPSGP